MVGAYNPNVDPVICIIDGAHTLRRNLFQPNMRSLSNSTGMPTGGIYGFSQSLKSVCNAMSAVTTVVAWEGGHSARRLEVYPEYKMRDPNKEQERDEHGMTDYEFYTHQLSWTQKLLDSLGIVQVSVSGKEGDDVLYQLVHLLRGKKIIVSEDKDFFSLVSDDVAVYRPIKKEYVDLGNFEDITGCPTPRHYLYLKALLGDGSDNIPSVAKGVGSKTALDVLKEISAENLSPTSIIKEAALSTSKRTRKLLEVGEAPIIRNLNLIDISKETFNIFELQSIVDALNIQRYPNVSMATKIMDALEFSAETQGYLTNKLVAMSTFPIANLVDKGYLKEYLKGQTVLGG